MKLKLTKPLIIFDLETTGLDLVNDRIVQISYIKIFPDGRETRGNELVNPEKPIPEKISQLIGISDSDVAGKPTFRQIAGKLAAEFEGCDFAGFNSNHFDIPMLAEEFARTPKGIDFSKCRMVDIQTIFHKMERRDLAAAYKFYCGREMKDDFTAHRADQDTEATYRVLMGQLDRYSADNEPDPNRQLQNDIAALAEFSRQNNNVDFAGRIVWGEKKDKNGNTINDENGQPIMTEVFNFGKHKGKAVSDVLKSDFGYYSWMMNGDFTNNTKQVLTRIKMRG